MSKRKIGEPKGVALDPEGVRFTKKGAVHRKGAHRQFMPYPPDQTNRKRHGIRRTMRQGVL